MSWSIRPLDPVVDRGNLAVLWSRALAPAWPLLPYGLSLLRRGYAAEVGDELVGAVAVDEAILFIAVDPSQQRRGLGSVLLEHALRDLAADGVSEVPVGAGRDAHIWPGVPTELTGALAFFSKHGWRWHDTVSDMALDLPKARVTDLVDAHPPPAGVEVTTVRPADMGDVLDFEERHFPEWSRFYDDPATVLVARHGSRICGTLLYEGPGQVHRFWSMLGEDSGSISCVGVDPQAQHGGIGSAMIARATKDLAARGVGTCLIGWAVAPDFYRRLGYWPWREYRMGSRRTR